MSEERHDEDPILDLLYPDGLEPARLAALRRQVESDPALAERLSQYEVVRRMVATLPVPEPERAVHYELLRQARAAVAESGAPARRSLFAWLSTLQLGPALAGALGLMLAVGGTMVLTRESGEYAPAPSAGSSPTPSNAVAAQAPVEKASLSAQTVVAAAAPSAPPTSAAFGAPASMAAPGASARAAESGWYDTPKLLEAEEAEKKPSGARGRADQGSLDDPFGGEGKSTLGHAGKGVDDALDGLVRGSGGASQPEPVLAGDARSAPNGPTAEPARRAFAPPPPPAAEPVEAREARNEFNGLKATRSDNTAEYDADDGVVSGVTQATSPGYAGAPAPRTESERAKAAPAEERQAAKKEDARPPPPKANAGAEVDELVAALDESVESSVESPRPAKAAPRPLAKAPAAPPPADPSPAPDVARGPAPPAQVAAAAAPAPTVTVAAAEPAGQAAKTGGDSSDKKGKAAQKPQSAGSPLEQARIARKMRQLREAVRHYESFIERFPNHAELSQALFETAETYEQLGDVSRALELYRLIARNGGGRGQQAEKRIEELQRQRRKAAAPAGPPQAAPATNMDTENPATAPAERK